MTATATSAKRTKSSKSKSAKSTTKSKAGRNGTATNPTVPEPALPSVLPPAQICHLVAYCNVVYATEIDAGNLFDIIGRTIRHFWGENHKHCHELGELPKHLDYIDIFEDDAPKGCYVGTPAAIAELDALNGRKWDVQCDIVAAVHRLVGHDEIGGVA